MKERVIMERAGIGMVSYGLVLAAHAELPGTVPFGLFLLALVVAVATLAAVSGASRPVATGRGASASGRARVGRDRPAPGAGAASRRISGVRGPNGSRPSRGPESIGLGAMRASLRRLEGELHALEDQRLTELARVDERAGRAFR